MRIIVEAMRRKREKNPHKLVVVVMSHVSKSGDTTSARRSFHIQILVHARSIQDPFESIRSIVLAHFKMLLTIFSFSSHPNNLSWVAHMRIN